ncbi:hypothetical protein ATI61_104205 [Archangium gephyra]|uniref:Uncharacterized protein n=1 Tax=Archangium gephyra TaxID=48 RepID=A0AAC8TC39_9BACT|nr:hypothetical protein [Archangium gephyra]AKJ00388.1 Hypothetical protein AA314_02014 [Archangium gephyra]REG32915.1 hypothetical protein ATI61_104205 [Archangium gephyra]
MKKFARREVAHVVAMVGMLFLGVRCAGMEEVESEHPHLMLDNALLVGERTGLQVCVELAPALKERSGELLGALKSDLALLRERHPLWEKSGFGQAPVRVQLGCPGAAMPSARLESKGALVGPGVSEHPSPFRTFLYVLDDAGAQEVLGKEQALRARAELLKVEDHVLAEVSTALVIRASDLGTPSFQETWLPTGVGLPPLREPAAVPSADFLPKVSGGSGMDP